MEMIDAVPGPVLAAQQIGCVLEFVRFGGADGTEAEARAAVGMAVQHACAGWPPKSDGTPQGAVDLAQLGRLTPRVLTRDAFLGEWADPRTGDLVRAGSCTMSDGRRLENPTYRQLDVLERAGVMQQSGASSGAGLWAGGEFAYAFAHPPYSLPAGACRVLAVFEALRDFLLPPGASPVILDWATDEVVALCPDYFEPGTEWWGVFVFTIYVPEQRTLTVILGSATD